MTTFFVRDIDNSLTPVTTEQVLAAAQAILKRRLRVGSPILKEPKVLQDYLCCRYGALDHEVYGVVFLDSRHRLICIDEMFRGGVNETPVPIGAVVKAALMHAASALVCFHCHPSGSTEPSSADELHTARLRMGLALIDVELMDHLIIAGDTTYSFRQNGQL